MCTSIRREKNIIGRADWNYLIRGTTRTATSPNPDPSFITAAGWDFLNYAQ